MKTLLRISMIVMALVFTDAATAQVFRISSFGQQNILTGDFGKSEFNNPNAGYVQYSASAGIEFNYYSKSKLGFGIRWMNQSYQINTSSFERDFINEFGLTEGSFYFSQPLAYWSLGSDIGISYLLDLNEKWQLEPYFYVGFRGLVRRNVEAIYLENGSTFQYQSKLPVLYGYNFIPGAKIHWNFSKHFSLNLSAEYQSVFFFEDDETMITSSANSLDIAEVKRSFDANSFNIGLGLSFRFGKGLNE